MSVYHTNGSFRSATTATAASGTAAATAAVASTATATAATNYLNLIDSQMKNEDDSSSGASTATADDLSEVLARLKVTQARGLKSRAEIDEKNKRGHMGVNPKEGVKDSSTTSINLSKVDEAVSIKTVATVKAAQNAALAADAADAKDTKQDMKDVKGMSDGPSSSSSSSSKKAAAATNEKPLHASFAATPMTAKQRRDQKAAELRKKDQDRRAQIDHDRKQSELARLAIEQADKNPNKNADKKHAKMDDEEANFKSDVAPVSSQQTEIQDVKALFDREFAKELELEFKKAGISPDPPENPKFASPPKELSDAEMRALTPDARDEVLEKQQEARAGYEQTRLAEEEKHRVALEKYYALKAEAEKKAEATVIATHPAAARAKETAKNLAISEKALAKVDAVTRLYTSMTRWCKSFAAAGDTFHTAYTVVMLPKGVSAMSIHPGTKVFHDILLKQSSKMYTESRTLLFSKGHEWMVKALGQLYILFNSKVSITLKQMPKGTTFHLSSHAVFSEQIAGMEVKLFAFFCRQLVLPPASTVKVLPIPAVSDTFGPKDLATCVNADGTIGLFDHANISAALLARPKLTEAEKKMAKTDEKMQETLYSFIGQCHSFAVYYLQNALYNSRPNFVQWIFMGSEHSDAFNSVKHQRNSHSRESIKSVMWYPNQKLDFARFRSEIAQQVSNLILKIELDQKMKKPRATYVRYYGGKPADVGEDLAARFELVVDVICVMPVDPAEFTPLDDEAKPTAVASKAVQTIVVEKVEGTTAVVKGAAKASVVRTGKDEKSSSMMRDE